MTTLGRFRILREIARSNDIVWEGEDPLLGRRVAVKELSLNNGDFSSREMRIARFHREAKAAGALSHPNIVVIHDFGEDSGRHYIAMEYLEGRSLRERLRAEGKLPADEARRIASAVCGALAYAHGKGVVHRDVKPDNIHLLPDGRVKLTDFGIARIAEETSLTVAGQVYGTPSYMAPEQIRGGAIDARTDLFALGVVLYEMLAGAKPFTGDRIETVTYRILTEPTPLLPSGPADFDRVIQRATQKDPGMRYADAFSMGRDLSGGASHPTVGLGSVQPGYQSTSDRTVAMGAWGAAPNSAATGGSFAGTSSPQAGWADNRTVVAPQASVPQAPPVYASPPPVAQQSTSGSIVARWVAAVAVAAVLGIGGFLLVGRAVRNAGLRMAVDNGKDALNRGVALYQAKDFARAAVVFANVRTAPGADEATREQATTYEGYCYRELANAAQRNSDWSSAVRWWRMACDLAPGDAELATKKDAAEKYLASIGEPLPGPEPEPDRTTEHPKPRQQGTPNTTRADVQNNWQQAAVDADRLLREGDAAAQRGDNKLAQDLWKQARDRGVGTSTFAEADKRLNADSASNSPF